MSPASAVLDSSIHAILQLYRSNLPDILFQFESGCQDTMVAMHERFVRSICRNLLRNAVHAIKHGRSIEKTVHIRTAVDGAMVRIEIKNSGPGVRPEVIPFLFKRLVPHEDGRKGRGLLLVGFLVEQHGGRIEAVQSDYGKGVLFRFWLPVYGLDSSVVET